MTPPQRQLFGFNPMLGRQIAGRHINVAFTCLKRNAFQIGRLCVVGWILRYWATEFAFLLVFSFVGLLVIQQTVLRLSKPILTDRVLSLIISHQFHKKKRMSTLTIFGLQMMGISSYYGTVLPAKAPSRYYSPASLDTSERLLYTKFFR